MSFIEAAGTLDSAFRGLHLVREVSQLVQVVEVLSALQQDLLLVVEVLTSVKTLVLQHLNIVLQLLDLIVEVDELLSLLLKQKRTVSNVEVHEAALSRVGIFIVSSLLTEALQAVSALLPQLRSVVEEDGRLLDATS